MFYVFYYCFGMKHIAIIGGGAAGCFAAIALKRLMPTAGVTVYESGRRPLAKVAITGGGRCNLTNSFSAVRSIDEVYPRGARLMRRLFNEFDHGDAYVWFEREGVELVTQADGCVFPKSQDAMQIVNTLVSLMRDGGARLVLHHRVTAVERLAGGSFSLHFDGAGCHDAVADAVLVATGGMTGGMRQVLEALGVKTVATVPSLFGLCVDDKELHQLTGTVVPDVSLGMVGTKLKTRGTLLVTHWGMSGPAILRMSSYAARVLNENGYKAALSVDWLSVSEAEAGALLSEYAAKNPQKQLQSVYPEQLNARLWHYLLRKSGVDGTCRWSGVGKKNVNKMINVLTNDTYRIVGKNRFKEEFVTCGGVKLGDVNPNTLECRSCPGLFVAGEALDMDAVTGGFNLQGAWTTGYVAARGICKVLA